MQFLIEKRKEFYDWVNRNSATIFITLSVITLIFTFNIPTKELEVVLYEEEITEEEFLQETELAEQEIKVIETAESKIVTPPEIINGVISKTNIKCSQSVLTNSKAIYYIKWEDADMVYRTQTQAVKDELNRMSNAIEGIWKSHGKYYIVEVVLDSQISDSVLAVSTNGRITFTKF